MCASKPDHVQTRLRSGVKSSMLVYGFGHLWIAMILVLFLGISSFLVFKGVMSAEWVFEIIWARLKFDDWRLPMTTNGQNAPLNEAIRHKHFVE